MSPWLLLALALGWPPVDPWPEEPIRWASSAGMKVGDLSERAIYAVFVDTDRFSMDARCVIVFDRGKRGKDGRMWGWLVDRQNNQIMRIHTRESGDQIPAWCYKDGKKQR